MERIVQMQDFCTNTLWFDCSRFVERDYHLRIPYRNKTCKLDGLVRNPDES